MKKIAILLVLCIFIGVLPGCREKTKDSTETISGDYQIMDFNQYKDSDDIPSWHGEKLNLVKWVNVGSPNATNKGRAASSDVVSPEIERVTGITYDSTRSFDNASSSFDAKVAKMVASGEYPHVAEGIPDPTGLIDAGALWGLSELIKEYAPNVYKLFGPDSKTMFGDEWNRQMTEYGDVYALPFGKTISAINDMVAKDGAYGLTEEQAAKIYMPQYTPYPSFYIRDDVLKKLYPQAHTVAELQKIYEKNGKFTKEEIFDVPIDSPEDFVNLLYDIKALKLEDGNGEIYPIFTHNGGDNWTVLCQLGGMFGYHTNPSTTSVNYFSYYDLEDDQIKYTFKEPWFKEILKTYNKLINDDVASKEALIDTDAIFREKLNNGRYIVCYGNYEPSEQAIAGKYAYREVFARYKINTEKYLYPLNDYTTYNRISLFKTMLSKEQAIQVVRMLDFMASDPGQKLVFWGPRSAGLYEETEDGGLKYTVAELDEEMRTGVMNMEARLKYAIGTDETWPGYFRVSASKYHPKAYYPALSTWKTEFKAVKIEQMELTPSKVPNLYEPAVMNVIPNFAKFWAARSGFENALVKVFAATSDSDFEKYYKEMVLFAEKNGLTEDALVEFNNMYKNEYNAPYMKYIK